jgi:hypothetical protein
VRGQSEIKRHRLLGRRRVGRGGGAQTLRVAAKLRERNSEGQPFGDVVGKRLRIGLDFY